MIRFSDLQGGLANYLRRVARLVPPSATLRVLQGPLRGAKWIAGAGSASYWLGSYEPEVQEAMADSIAPGAVVYDIGANVGFHTLLAARLAGPSGWVYAFEPMPANAAILRTHVALNRVSNVRVVEAAVSDRAGEVQFGGAGATAREADGAGRTVRAVSLDEEWRAGRLLAPTFVKLDVEGGELAVLRGMRAVLGSARPTVILELHGDVRGGEDVDTLSRTLLHDAGYDLHRLTPAKFLGLPS